MSKKFPVGKSILAAFGIVAAQLTASPAIAREYTFAWDHAGADGFKLHAAAVGKPEIVLDVGNVRQAPFPLPSDNYDVTVTAYATRINAAGQSVYVESGPSNTVPLSVTPPNAPAFVSTTPTSATTARVNWSAAQDGPPGYYAAGYGIHACVERGCTNFTLRGATADLSFTLTNLVPDMAYRVRVDAADTAGNISQPSAAAGGQTPPAGAPKPPTFAAAQVKSATEINIVAAQVANASSYAFDRCQGTGCSNFVRVGTMLTIPGAQWVTFVDKPLSPNTPYGYQITACNAAGCSSPPAKVSGTTSPAP